MCVGRVVPEQAFKTRQIKQRQCDGQWVLSKRSSLRQPTSSPPPPTIEALLTAFLWPSVRHAIQGVDKTYDLSPLFPSLCPLPWLKSGCWTGQPSSSILQHTSAAWRTGPSFVSVGIWGSKGVKLIDTSSSTSAFTLPLMSWEGPCLGNMYQLTRERLCSFNGHCHSFHFFFVCFV